MRDIDGEVTTLVTGGRVLTPAGLVEGTLALAGDRIAGIVDEPGQGAAERIDAQGALVLPGIVDLHGDAFERQVMPRPGAVFPVASALHETDRQLLSNGITTAFYALTVSWEPGLRSESNAAALVEAIVRHRTRLGCDTRLHIRWETFALEAEATVAGWLDLEPRPILAFNDHTTGLIRKGHIARKLPSLAERAGVTQDAYRALVDAVWERRDEVPAAIERLAAAARAKGCVILGHDEKSPGERARFRALGARTSEFPLDRATALAAREAGEHAVLGAPNVVRGGSHIGMLDAAPAIAEGLCTVLASDYHYPAPILAAFRLVRDGTLDLQAAWALVSANPADAAGLADRGRIAPGQRADLAIVDDADPEVPRVLGTVVAGRTVLSAC